MVSDKKKILKMFNKLLELHEDSDEEAFDELVEKIRDLDLEFAIKSTDSLDWIESDVEGFSEFPVVTQKVTLTLGDCVVEEWDLEYGCECVDYSHTGTQDQWVPLRIDEQENAGLEEMLEWLEVEIPTPVVPPPKAV